MACERRGRSIFHGRGLLRVERFARSKHFHRPHLISGVRVRGLNPHYEAILRQRLCHESLLREKLGGAKVFTYRRSFPIELQPYVADPHPNERVPVNGIEFFHLRDGGLPV